MIYFLDKLIRRAIICPSKNIFNLRQARNKTLQTVDSDLHSSFNNTENEVAGNENEYNENPLKCPLELSNLSELGTGLKTLVSKQGGIMEFSPKMNNNLIKKKSSLGVFDTKDEEKKKKTKKEKKKKNEIEKFISPFQVLSCFYFLMGSGLFI